MINIDRHSKTLQYYQSDKIKLMRKTCYKSEGMIKVRLYKTCIDAELTDFLEPNKSKDY